MLIDLRDIIDVPGVSVAFDYETDLQDAAIGSITGIEKPARVVGKIVNHAGALEYTAEVTAECSCVCARCLKEFIYPARLEIAAFLASAADDGDESDYYFYSGDSLESDEVVISEFILAMDGVYLCREDCLGLCQNCGADKNVETCSCDAGMDERLQILSQLLSG